MKILLVSTRMGTAGVETLILRMAKFLNDTGHIVHVLLLREVDKVSANHLRKYAKVYIGCRFWKLHKLLRQTDRQYYDCIYAFSFFPLVYALYIRNKYFPKTKICCGVYHPMEYCWVSNSNTLLARIAADLIKKFPKENIFFMNQSVKDRHCDKLKHDFIASPVIPLPVDISRFNNTGRNFKIKKPYKIVSVGRITNFKTYNFTMIHVVRQLINLGYPVEYHIYGHGEQFKELSQAVKKNDMDRFIFLHGELPYENFSLALTDAFLFLGMGTALVEAASCKVPCLQAIEMDRQAESYGFFHELKGFNVGEKDLIQPRIKIIDLIIALIGKSSEEYKKICELSYQRATDFDINHVMHYFLSHCNSSKQLDLCVGKKNTFYVFFNMICTLIFKLFRIRTINDKRYAD